ncbi:Spherulation-specific family 4 domain containing protein [Rhypophila sp. PSN 637]
MPDISPSTTSNVHHQPRPPFILIPLYIYPSEKGKTWAPLFEAVKKHPEVSFVVIVNPDSGPGRGHKPDDNYTSALEALAGFENVTVLGYVPVFWAGRDVADVIRDIRVYYSWEQVYDNGRSPSIRIDGIFFDEAPSKETEETVIYMGKAAADDFNPNTNRCTIIYNPGTPPSPGCAFFDSSSHADYIVIFEQTLETWPSRASTINLPEERAKSIAIAHSVLSLDHQLTFAAQVVEYRGLAGHFATSTADYASWTNNGGPRYLEDCDVSGHRGEASSNSGALWLAYVDAAHQLFRTHVINAGEGLKPPADQSVDESSS